MTIHLEVTKRTLTLPRSVQAIVSNALTRKAMEPRANRELDRHTSAESSSTMSLHEDTLDQMMVKYSEQAVFNPRREIQHWFGYKSGAHLEPGYLPLFYFRNQRTKPSINKSAVAAVGEGIAGFIAQRLYGCSMLARPNHDYPDIVMEANSITYLVESKATSSSEPRKEVNANRLRFASNTASAELMDSRPLKGLLISTRIETEHQFRTDLLEIEIAP